VKKVRLARLNHLLNEIGRGRNEEMRGEIVEVLVEGESKNNPEMLSGRTRTNKLVHFQGHAGLTAQLVHVRILEPQTWVLKGELVSSPEQAQVV
jgi:tRNA-2-methylthio-N6-dimethylallyladenosine synthase